MYLNKFRFLIITINIYIIIYNFKICNLSKTNKNEFDLILPIRFSDIENFLKNQDFYKKYLNYSTIVLIASVNNISKSLLKDKSINIIPEDIIVPKIKINEYLLQMKNITTKRDSWYEQQFLKMGYSRICKKNFYLVWDVDTIPIKLINMFENDHPFFDMKGEHHTPYFNTINQLIPGLKFSNRSYISEHMLIKTELMKNLLKCIEKNRKIPGKFFWQKILMAISIHSIHKSGFSEFETYGTFVDTKYPNIYIHRKWYSKRDAKIFYGNSSNLSQDDINWLSIYYHALTFEKYHIFNEKKFKIVKNKSIYQHYKPNKFFTNFKALLIKYKQTKIK